MSVLAPSCDFSTNRKQMQRDIFFDFVGDRHVDSALLLPHSRAHDLRRGLALGVFDNRTNFCLVERNREVADQLEDLLASDPFHQLSAKLHVKAAGLEEMKPEGLVDRPLDLAYFDTCGVFRHRMFEWQTDFFLSPGIEDRIASRVILGFTYVLNSRRASNSIVPIPKVKHVYPQLSSFTDDVHILQWGSRVLDFNTAQILLLPGHVLRSHALAYMSNLTPMVCLMYEVELNVDVAQSKYDFIHRRLPKCYSRSNEVSLASLL
jgi:hypothetical protein